MIERQKERYGWEFLFLGANIDAAAEARRFGISDDRAVNYKCDAPGTSNEIVVCYRFFILEPDYKLGDTIEFEVDGVTRSFKIVGSLKEIGKAVVYINNAGLDTLVPDGAKRSSIRLCTTAAALDNRSAENIYKGIERDMRHNGVSVFQSESSSEHYGILTSHYLNTFLSFLLGAIMVVIVASFGLAST